MIVPLLREKRVPHLQHPEKDDGREQAQHRRQWPRCSAEKAQESSAKGLN